MFNKHLLLALAIFIVACQRDAGDTGSPASGDDSSSGANAQGGGTVAKQPGPAGGSSGSAGGGSPGTALPRTEDPPGSGGAADGGGEEDRNNAVDVGNPDDTGPNTENGKLKLYLADAPIADSLEGLLIRPTALDLVDAFGQVVATLPVDPSPIDLTDYTEGHKLLLYDGDVPVGRYTEVRVRLDQENPASVIRFGLEEAVLVPALATVQGGPVQLGGPKALFGDLSLDIALNETQDVTMHVDLRRQLRRITEGLPLGWLLFSPDADYWLDPESATFLSDTVGTLVGVGLGALTKVACVYKVAPNTPLNLLGIPILTGADADSGCSKAQGSTVVHQLTFRIDYLPPGTYAIRLFVGDLIYADLPGLHSVLADTVVVLDL